jgi:type I restriction enzyme S subunit
MDFSNYPIPLNWEIKALKDACQFSKKPRGLIVKGKIPFFPMEIIPQNGIYAQTSIYKNSDEIGSSTFINNGDIVLAKITPSFENGKQAIINIEESYAYATTEVIPFNQIGGISNKLFLFYVLKHPVIRLTLAGQMEGSTGRQRLSKEVLGRYKIPLPPIEEQRKIASVLSLVQDAIAQQEQLITLTTELKKALMQKLFTEGTRNEPQKMTEIGLIPESWDLVPLDNLLILTQYGLSVKGGDSGKYPILRMTNQVDGKIVSKNLQYVDIKQDDFKKFKLEYGDILFNRTNSFELVGRTAIFDIDSDFIFASYLIRLRINQDKLNSFFLNYYFNWQKTQIRLKGIATRAVSQSNISASRLKGFIIPLPKTLEEQDEIVKMLDYCDYKIAVQRQKYNILNDLFRTLLHQLMTAQIRVNDLNLSALNLEIQGGNE